MNKACWITHTKWITHVCRADRFLAKAVLGCPCYMILTMYVSFLLMFLMLPFTAQGFFPARGIRQYWSRPPMVPVPMPVPAAPQPWVLVQHQPEHAPEGLPTEVPSQPPFSPVQTQQPSAPLPAECPVCKALLPPSVNRDEHVNGHFDHV